MLAGRGGFFDSGALRRPRLGGKASRECRLLSSLAHRRGRGVDEARDWLGLRHAIHRIAHRPRVRAGKGEGHRAYSGVVEKRTGVRYEFSNRRRLEYWSLTLIFAVRALRAAQVPRLRPRERLDAVGR